ncbi:hypothetical protein SUGI_0527790 [Cryptomeria japonica]|nr:hypothetical protein SUGI_0527790 [Cryptomeria japonica]
MSNNTSRVPGMISPGRTSINGYQRGIGDEEQSTKIWDIPNKQASLEALRQWRTETYKCILKCTDLKVRNAGRNFEWAEITLVFAKFFFVANLKETVLSEVI